MAIPNIVPRANNDGETLGTATKQWTNVHTKDVSIDGASLKTDLASIKNDKANKATTLAGYGITDGYTKTEADNRYLQKSGGTLTNVVSGPDFRALNPTTNKGVSLYSADNGNRGLYENNVDEWLIYTNDDAQGYPLVWQDGRLQISDKTNKIATASYVKGQITYQEFTLSNISYGAGTIGTRGYQGSISAALSGYRILGATIVRWDATSDAFIPVLIPFASSNTVFLNLYRANSYSLPERTITIRVWYCAD